MTAAAAAVAAAQEALSTATGSAVRLGVPTDLGGSSRTLVLRVPVVSGDRLPAAVVVKAHLDGGPWETWVREPAALDLLGATPALAGLVPRLLAVAEQPPLVVLADLGADRTDLASLLLGADRHTAEDGLLSWAATVGRLHAGTAGTRSGLRAALQRHAQRLARPAPPDDDLPDALGRAADALADLLPRLGVAPPAAALDTVRHLQDLLADDPLCWVLTPGDTCPDNNLLTDEGLVLLDFEGAAARHLAWDAAYLRVPWPSCWCSWALPSDVADRALRTWRDVVGARVPAVRGPGFDADLEVAEAGWAAISTSWFLERALAEDAAPHAHDTSGTSDPARVAPNRRAVIQHRLTQVAAGTDPRLADWGSVAAAALAATRDRWGDHPLPLAPAFRGD